MSNTPSTLWVGVHPHVRPSPMPELTYSPSKLHLSSQGQCLTDQGESLSTTMSTCDPKSTDAHQQWFYDHPTQHLVNLHAGKCLTVNEGGEATTQDCIADSPVQRFTSSVFPVKPYTLVERSRLDGTSTMPYRDDKRRGPDRCGVVTLIILGLISISSLGLCLFMLNVRKREMKKCLALKTK